MLKKLFSLIAPTLIFAAATQASSVSVPLKYDTLSNGLRVLIVPDTSVAVVSCRLYYFVGSMYEGPGTTGLSHMFEHMMFKGTKTLGTSNYAAEVPYLNRLDTLEAAYQKLRAAVHPDSVKIAALRDTIMAVLDKERKYIKKDEIWDTYEHNGGTDLNAWTADEMTGYLVTLPKNKTELFCWIESDRMANRVLREFFSERDVVAEERRMRYDNRPIGTYWEHLNALFYIANPYRFPTIGWPSDIQAYTRVKLEEHVKKYYTPDNALMVFVGNVDTTQTFNMVKKYFEKIPRAVKPVQQVVTREPAPVGQTRFTMQSSAQPRIDILWHVPGYPNSDLYALDIAGDVLSGKSGRLYQKLVNEKGLCTSIEAGLDMKLTDGNFDVSATLKNGVSPDTVERLILDEVAKLVKDAPSKSEIERVTNNMNCATGTKICRKHAASKS